MSRRPDLDRLRRQVMSDDEALAAVQYIEYVERSLVLIEQNCVGLANDDDPAVELARELALNLQDAYH